VGEQGPEFFVPSTSGRIVPNNNLSSIRGSAMQPVIIGGSIVADGRNLKVILARQDRYQLRNV
jgi:hypothetical protein